MVLWQLLLEKNLFGISTDGRLLWQQDLRGRPFAWATTDEQLILSTSGPNHATWTISPSHGPLRMTTLTGYPVNIDNETWLYAEDGLYRLDPALVNPELIYQLPPAYLLQSRITPLPNGGVLLAHADRFDRRLIALNADGSLRWQRSYQAITADEIRLLALNDQLYLLTITGNGAIRTLDIYALNVDTAELSHIFTGGTRTAIPNQTWATSTHNNTFLINIGGGHLFHFNPTLALEQIITLSE